MQYEADLSTYKRISKKKENKKIKLKSFSSFIKAISIFLGAFLISRVVITINVNILANIAPFGIAFLLASLDNGSKKQILLSYIGVLVGYISIFNQVKEMPMYLSILIIIPVLKKMLLNFNSKLFECLSFLVILSFNIIFKISFNEYTLYQIVLIGLLQTLTVYAIYYILKHGLKNIYQFNLNKHLISEEIISIAILTCLIISGIGNIYIFNLSAKNIIALFFIIVTAYITNASVGSAVGIILGIIMGMTTNNMMLHISAYGICGLIVGFFKKSGKIISLITYLLMYSILSIYSNTFQTFKPSEILIVCLIFILIPKKNYEKLSIEFDNNRNWEETGEMQLVEMKNEFSSKLQDFTDVLSCISVTLDNLVDNEKLFIKNKGVAIVENLADRVCSNCDMKQMCWKREAHSTYEAFSELIRNYQEGQNDFPEVLRKKCVKEYALIKNVEEIINNYVANEMVKKKMSEGRKVLSNHINNMASTISEISDDFIDDINLASDIEKTIKKAFIKNEFKYDNILCYIDKRGRVKVKITIDNNYNSDKIIKQLLTIINNCLNRKMTLAEDKFIINKKNNKIIVNIEEAPKYNVSSIVSLECKDGEKFTGDSYTFGRGKDGSYVVILSDGMGSGPEAGAESKATVDIIESFVQAGFNDLSAINTVNSIMTMKFTEDETFATLDMYNIDLYTGNTTFMKVGAVESFIKRGDKVFIVNSNTLPFGILDKPDVDITDKKVINGDLIITISDGILEVGGQRESNYKWIIDFLRSTKIKNPKELSNEIVSIARELNEGKIKDDMTIIISKICEI